MFKWMRLCGLCAGTLLLPGTLIADEGNHKIYGVIDAYVEQVADTPAGVDNGGNTIKESNAHEFDLPNLTVMFQGNFESKYSYFLSLAGPGTGFDDGVGVRNGWVQVSLLGDYLNVRAGKLYRRFGLYNEILDATPTYIGIEPPELFDKDHLLLTRTTNLMIHGKAPLGGPHEVYYALFTGNDERKGSQLPLGLDFHYVYESLFKLGTSFYTSGGRAAPSKGVGEGSPSGGVLPWMAEDDFLVYGAYAQLEYANFLLQAEFWQADHKATRDPDKTLSLLAADLNTRQLTRFGVGGVSPVPADVNTDGDYSVTTVYVRSGYKFEQSFGDIEPYLQYDWYRNPETIANKSFGGDNEAGLSDNGEFHKITGGVVFRPVPSVALKIDGSMHVQDFNGESEPYPEVRASFSYLWSLVK